jgi:probable F420-dependent oxidoreductase
MSIPQLGRLGLWSMELRFGDKAESGALATELEVLGFGALWIPGGIDGGVLADVDRLLAATRRITVCTGILNIWKHDPKDVAAWFKALPAASQDRVLIGLGTSHAPIIGDAWKKPMAALERFLDALEQAGMPKNKLCLAALGPKMLALARDRTLGSHPYLVTPAHTAQARQILGPGKLLAPEQGVVLESNPDRARAIAREALAVYSQLPNYRKSWLRLGFSLEDIDTASDKLVDALFAWGAMEKIVERIDQHRQAGADHVCVQVIRGAAGGDMAGLGAACRELAGALERK